MTIEIHQPELEALIRQRMESGEFQNLDELLIQALKAQQLHVAAGLSPEETHRQRLFDWMNEAGTGWNLELHPELANGAARWVDLLRRDDDAIDSGVTL
jgi:hypothetical protein